jgi:hypothetical protein
MVPGPSCEVHSRTSRYISIDWEGRESDFRDFPGHASTARRVLYSQSPLGAPAVPPVLSPLRRKAPSAYHSRGCLGFWVWHGVCHSDVLHSRGQYAHLGLIFRYTISVTDALHLDYDRECAFWSQTVILGKSKFQQ